MAMFLFLFLLLLFWFSNVIFLGRGYCCRWCMIADVAACYSCLCSTEIKMRICTRDRETYTNTNARSPHVRISIYIYMQKRCALRYIQSLCMIIAWICNGRKMYFIYRIHDWIAFLTVFLHLKSGSEIVPHIGNNSHHSRKHRPHDLWPTNRRIGYFHVYINKFIFVNSLYIWNVYVNAVWMYKVREDWIKLYTNTFHFVPFSSS